MSVQGEWMGDVVKGRLRDAAAQGLLDGAEIVRAKSVAVAPKEHGELRASASADVDPNTLIAAVSYDTGRDIKTIKQHEDLTYRHPPGEQAKFLEEPANNSRAAVQSALTTRIDRGLR